jgi:hypothetical protein
LDVIGTTVDRKTGLQVCNPDLNMMGYNGIIIQISNNIIQVRVPVTNDGNMAFVLLGACYRLEISGELPAPGNMIFWKGVQVGKCILCLDYGNKLFIFLITFYYIASI